LHYPYEVREEHEVFDEISNEHIPKDMLDLAVHILTGLAAHFHSRRKSVRRLSTS
jgi:DNA end-binding protein Ku